MEWKEFSPGTIFENRYRIESVLGIGGFAHVYRATQIDLGRVVALKVLRPIRESLEKTDAADPTPTEVNWARRFEQEAKVISRLSDPHTITMFDFGHTDDGRSYMVFEFISGQPLNAVVRQTRGLEPKKVVEILRQCLESLYEAHTLGILHRDIKPANIMLYEHMGRMDRVKVLDFGIAKSMTDQDGMPAADLTRAGVLLGTPRYMSPEQLMGNPMGPPSDLYSLGLVGYELLTGEQAVTGNNTMQIITRHISEQPIELPPDLEIPERLRHIFAKLLEKRSEHRYQSAREVLDDLESWDEASSLPMLAIELVEDPVEVQEDNGVHSEALSSPIEYSGSKSKTLIWTSTALLVIIAVVLALRISADDSSPTSSDPAALHATPSADRLVDPGDQTLEALNSPASTKKDEPAAAPEEPQVDSSEKPQEDSSEKPQAEPAPQISRPSPPPPKVEQIRANIKDAPPSRTNRAPSPPKAEAAEPPAKVRQQESDKTPTRPEPPSPSQIFIPLD